MKSMVSPVTRVSLFCGLNIHKASFSPLTFFNSYSLPFTPTLSLSMAASSQSTPSTVSPGDVNINKDDVFQLIQAHQEKAARLPPVEEIRTVLDRSVRGMLSTFSKAHEGYPSGSLVDFAFDADGYPILAVSDLAVHAKDLTANPKCSLLVARDPEDRTDLVITLHGDAISVSEKDKEAVRAAYLARHPNAFWVDFGDFHFLRIEPKVVRFVSGVATALLGSGEFTGDEFKAAKVDPIAQFSKPVASHMNNDHAEDTKVIVQHWTSVPVDFANILDLDSLGFNVKAGYQGSTFKLRVPFPRRAADRKDVKTLIVEMLHAATPKVN
ncbi:unnamed protein product [Lupinus luteus]|uniref:DUF2470 domain-containing protein n=1 Tax=Lupinus luteus TaxID=3873 RepID=A0AAV1XNU8_LUPLU